jgi:hypothetical protein
VAGPSVAGTGPGSLYLPARSYPGPLLLPLVVFPRLDLWLRARLRPAGQWAAAGALLVAVLFEFQPVAAPLMDSAAVPRVYQKVATLPGDVLFPIPFGLLDGYCTKGIMDSNELFYQTIHHKKLPGAYISRIPAIAFDHFDQDPVVYALLRLQTYPDSVPDSQPTVAQVTVFLRLYQPAAFVVHPAFRRAPVGRLLQLQLAGRGYEESVVDGFLLLKKRWSSPVVGGQVTSARIALRRLPRRARAAAG